MAQRESITTVGPGAKVGYRSARYTALQRHFLMRLVRLDAMRHVSRHEVVLGAEDQRLLDRALYATWLDCVAAGVGPEARAALSSGQRAG